MFLKLRVPEKVMCSNLRVPNPVEYVGTQDVFSGTAGVRKGDVLNLRVPTSVEQAVTYDVFSRGGFEQQKVCF